MFSDTVSLLDRDAVAMVYSKTIVGSTRTVRAVAGEPLDQPRELTLSHERSADGGHVNTAVMLDRVILDSGDLVTKGKVRLLFKMSYDVSQVTAADLQELRAQMVEFLSEANLVKLMNLEH